MVIYKDQIVVIIYLIIRDDVYLLPPGPALVTFPDICLTKPSDKGSTSLLGAGSDQMCGEFLTIKFLLR